MKRLLQFFAPVAFSPSPATPFTSPADVANAAQIVGSPLMDQAFTHRSYHNENIGESTGHNERLEFLGDAVLDLVVAGLLMEQNRFATEGQLSRWRARLVNEEVLARKALALGWGLRLRLGRGEEKTGGRVKPRLLACVFEAVVGAVYLEAGLEVLEPFLREQFAVDLEGLANEASGYGLDYKTRLQEVIQAELRLTPVYRLRSQVGPDHEKTFVVEVLAGHVVLGTGEGRSKKQAEQVAACRALEARQYPLDELDQKSP